jgi:5-(carboxyamino)imidazole ribonucleotide synthase
MLKVGIIGGGQLGRMLIQAGIDFDLEMHVLDSSLDSPCHGLAHEFVLGSVLDPSEIHRFAQGLSLLTLELENVSVEGLRAVAARGIPVYPQPEIVELIQDKGHQRAYYARNGFPGPIYQLWAPGEAVKLPFPLIQKSRRGGYDGRGVQRVGTPEHLWPVPSLLETEVAIWKEISVIVARSQRGEIKAFPPVEAVFHPEAHLVAHLRLPATLPPETLQEAQTIAEAIADQIGIVGLLAVEFFYTTDGQWLINEAAPRPHNTGHITTRATWTSQFEQHWRALLGLPLGQTHAHSYAALLNIIGPPGQQGKPTYPTLHELLSITGLSIHIYGKKRSSPYRKLGHVILLAEDSQTLERHLEQARERLLVAVA